MSSGTKNSKRNCKVKSSCSTTSSQLVIVNSESATSLITATCSALIVSQATTTDTDDHRVQSITLRKCVTENRDKV